ncbi:Fe-S cluster assembly sulfur transfer protein SufU [Nostoc sp. UIC 10630]|uniref:Fe-S cluster assembly sulfur transfer protein SufU n=1 Tax=Nostoc sp. UIC 10630 TaxID=2100146 RepID=UPI0013D05A95|nr:SUF system NifU family Fe-S cluster assembly protein [Nostoc sp. UIC 10630]NEU82307.1 SUF system NifU family Fe-S cluster assembly protein [Nostoc sp. UIC 10630]
MITLDDQRNLKIQVILAHYKQPRHRGRTNPVHGYYRGHTPYCGDTIELTIQINQTSNIIEDVKFTGEGCVIAIASADLMADALIGRTVDEALEMGQCFQNMMQGQGSFPDQPRELARLNVMQVINQPLRIKCANLSWYTLKAALKLSQINSLN